MSQDKIELAEDGQEKIQLHHTQQINDIINQYAQDTGMSQEAVISALAVNLLASCAAIGEYNLEMNITGLGQITVVADETGG